MTPEFVVMGILFFAALAIVVANDWWKRRLVEKAIVQSKKSGKRKRIRPDLLVNQTDWSMLAVLAVGVPAFIVLGGLLGGPNRVAVRVMWILFMAGIVTYMGWRSACKKRNHDRSEKPKPPIEPF